MLSRLVCLLLGHKWVKTAYDGADTRDGFFLRCKRCREENDADSSGVDGAMGSGF